MLSFEMRDGLIATETAYWSARQAFTRALELIAGICAIVVTITALVAAVLLRHPGTGAEPAQQTDFTPLNLQGGYGAEK